MNYIKLIVIGASAGLIAGLAACGSGDSNNSVTTAAPARLVTGAITAFGSVYVNGEKFDTDKAAVYIENSESSESELRVGMTVTVKSSTEGVAESIHFADDVEGVVIGDAVDNGDGTVSLDVMGQKVTANGDTIFESHVNGITKVAEIVDGNIVEVSGSSSGTGDILASRVEVKAADFASYMASSDHDSIEVKGIVSGHNEIAETFSIGSMTVSYNGAIVDDMPTGNWDGLYVEVKSTQDLNTDTLLASKVELEDGGSKGEHNDGDAVEVKGEISDYVTDTSVTVNGQTFLLDANTMYEHGSVSDLAVGIIVEVKGTSDASAKLVASKVEFDDHDNEIENEVMGPVTAINPTSANEGSIEINGLTIVINNSTIMHDDSMMHNNHFNLSVLSVGDSVEVDYIDVGGELTATKLERKAVAVKTPL